MTTEQQQQSGAAPAGVIPLDNLVMGFYHNAKSARLGGRITMAKVVTGIYSSRFAADTDALRLLIAEHGGKDNQAVKQRKASGFVGVTMSGVYPDQRAGDAMPVAHTGLYQVDIDKLADLDTAAQLREQAGQLPYVALAFVSPSGLGVKCFVRGQQAQTPDDHKRQWEWANRITAADLGREFDGAGVDTQVSAVNQLCFLCHDAGVRYNRLAQPLAAADDSVVAPKAVGRGGRRGRPGAGSGAAYQQTVAIAMGLEQTGYLVKWRNGGAFETTTELCHGGDNPGGLVIRPGDYAAIAVCFTKQCHTSAEGHDRAMQRVSEKAGVDWKPPDRSRNATRLWQELAHAELAERARLGPTAAEIAAEAQLNPGAPCVVCGAQTTFRISNSRDGHCRECWREARGTGGDAPLVRSEQPQPMDSDRSAMFDGAVAGLAEADLLKTPAPDGVLCDCGNRKFSQLAARCGDCAGVLLAETERQVESLRGERAWTKWAPVQE